MYSLCPKSFAAWLLGATLFAQAPPYGAGPVSKDAPQANQTPAARDRTNNNFYGSSAGTFPTRPPVDKASVVPGKLAYKTNRFNDPGPVEKECD